MHGNHACIAPVPVHPSALGRALQRLAFCAQMSLWGGRTSTFGAFPSKLVGKWRSNCVAHVCGPPLERSWACPPCSPKNGVKRPKKSRLRRQVYLFCGTFTSTYMYLPSSDYLLMLYSKHSSKKKRLARPTAHADGTPHTTQPRSRSRHRHRHAPLRLPPRPDRHDAQGRASFTR